jgi:hypothetical protein
MKPTVFPASEADRGAAATPAAFISLVGSSTRIMMESLSHRPMERSEIRDRPRGKNPHSAP